MERVTPVIIPNHSLKALFICRGSARCGLGHVVRARTVALELQNTATVKIAVIGDEYVTNLLAHKGLDFLVFTEDSSVMDYYREFRPDVVIFDLIDFSPDHFWQIQANVITISLSPIFDFLGEVDLIFHRTSYLGEEWPKSSKSALRCGLEYAVVAGHCEKIPSKVFEANLYRGPLSIAISMGGTDAANKTLRTLKTVKAIPEKILFWVLLGEGYMHSYQDLVDCMQESKHEIILAKTNDSMWRILSHCSLVILAGGTTTYEAAYAGLPSLITLESEKKVFLVQELLENGVGLCLGHTFPEFLTVLNDTIMHLHHNRNKLMDMHLRTQNLIDGSGIQRIIREIHEYCFHYKGANKLTGSVTDDSVGKSF